MLTKFWTTDSADLRMSRWLLLKVALPIAAIGVLLLGIATYAAWRVHRLQSTTAEIIAVNIGSIRAAEDLETAVREVHYRLRRAVIGDAERQLAEIPALLSRSRESLDEMRRLGATNRERDLVERMEGAFLQLQEGLARLDTLAVPDELAAGISNLADEVIPNKVIVYNRKYIEFNEAEMARGKTRSETAARQLIIGLLLLGTCGGLAGLLAGYSISRGVTRTLVQLSFPVRDVAGQLNNIVGPITVSADPSFQDLEASLQRISERVAQVVDNLQKSQHEALRAEQLAALGRLAAGLAHELRNPLTSMKMIVAPAAGDEPHELDHRDLEILQEEISRLEQLVQAFIDFARPPQMTKARVDMNWLVEQVVTLVAPRARTKGVNVLTRLSKAPPSAESDAAQMRQVVLNLLLNALDAVEQGGEVEIATLTEDGKVKVLVQDNGCGVPEHMLERIFDPFVSTKEAGLGLGLSTCRRIVEAHGGRLSTAPRDKGGSTFCVELPAAPLVDGRESSATESHNNSVLMLD